MIGPRSSGGRILAALGTGLVALAACGRAACAPAGGSGDSEGVPRVEIIVFAAASLSEAMGELAAEFKARHEGVEVVLNLAGSQTLASQIVEGAPADVFASANPVQMNAVRDAGHVAGEARVLTANRLAIAVERDNPLGIAGLEALADPALVVVLPGAEVPAGAYAREALAAAGVELAPSSFERDVRAALSKVVLGEADAAIVYETDLRAAGGAVTGVEIAAAHNVQASYAIARLQGASNPTAAEAFVAFVLSDGGQDILASHGFARP